MYERDRREDSYERQEVYIEEANDYTEEENIEDDGGGKNWDQPILYFIAGLLLSTLFLAISASLASLLVGEGSQNNQGPIQIELEQIVKLNRSFTMIERPTGLNQPTDSGDEYVSVKNRGSDVRIDDREDESIDVEDSARVEGSDATAASSAEAESSSNTSNQFENRERLEQLLKGSSPESRHEEDSYDNEDDYQDEKDNHYDEESDDKEKHKDSGH